MAQTKTLSYPSYVVETVQPTHTRRIFLFPLATLLLTECIVLLINAVLPLRGIWFYDALLTQTGSWSLFLTHLLFPHASIIIEQPITKTALPRDNTWWETWLLFSAFSLLFLSYLVAIYTLPRHISRRFLLLSTLLIGLTFALCPVMASQDAFSYIAYARMTVLYHLNPFTNFPTAISNDPVYPHVFWVGLSSLYGPTWIVICSSLQGLAEICGLRSVVAMVILLRLFSLTMHLGSTWLVWSIIGYCQKRDVFSFQQSQTRRMFATLAFAWNPLLLFEACVNAHSDTTVLFLLLLSLWLLLPRAQTSRYRLLLAVAVFASAVCLKANFILLLPGVFLFLWWSQDTLSSWKKRLNNMFAFTGACAAVVLLLYLPFWQNGDIIHVLMVNPNTVHEANSLYEVFIHLFVGGTRVYLPPGSSKESIPVENISHVVGTVLFALVYVALCIRTLLVPHSIDSISALTRWLALVWFSYCLLASPWFWPWYLTTCFGLFALIEADGTLWSDSWFGLLRVPLVVRAFTFTMLSIYCFSTWAPYASYIFGLQWLYLRGLWAWFLPLLILGFYPFVQRRRNRLYGALKKALLPTS